MSDRMITTSGPMWWLGADILMSEKEMRAASRARKLLLSHLTPAQQADLLENDAFNLILPWRRRRTTSPTRRVVWRVRAGMIVYDRDTYRFGAPEYWYYPNLTDHEGKGRNMIPHPLARPMPIEDFALALLLMARDPSLWELMIWSCTSYALHGLTEPAALNDHYKGHDEPDLVVH